ncbi:MAG: hypothetical protein OFPII_03980 [Osedax symbiont Rs1]|nr:MAG: hypothetical protein OFPII_03980 [Osedax symbiont Rs1]
MADHTTLFLGFCNNLSAHITINKRTLFIKLQLFYSYSLSALFYQ